MRRTRLFTAFAATCILLTSLTPASGQEGPTIEDPVVITSADGTPITSTLFLPPGASSGRRVPAVLMTHGWGGQRTTQPTGVIETLLQKDYAVITWDSRGFGGSGGEANMGSPDHEVKDAQAIIDYLAGRPEIELDAPGDPRIGWIGGSNAGGIQLNTAAFDSRVDAIVPQHTWGQLTHDIAPQGVFKYLWKTKVYGRGMVNAGPQGIRSAAGPQTGVYAKELHDAYSRWMSAGWIPNSLHQWFDRRSTVTHVSRVQAPTLIIQGTVDSLVTLSNGIALYERLRASGTPVKLMATCSGHTATGCPYPGGDSGDPEGTGTTLWEQRRLDWLDRYVKGSAVDTGPAFEFQLQDGLYGSSDSFPVEGTSWLTGNSGTTASLLGPGGTGGDDQGEGGPAGPEELGKTASRFGILEPSSEARTFVGEPRLDYSATVTGNGGNVFVELVEVSPQGTRRTVDQLVTPLALPAGDSTGSLRLPAIVWKLPPGHALEFEVSTGSAGYRPATGLRYRATLEATVRLPLVPN